MRKLSIVLFIVMILSFILSTVFFFNSGFFDFNIGQVTQENVNFLEMNMNDFLSEKFGIEECEVRDINETLALDLSQVSQIQINSLTTDVSIIESDSEYATFLLKGKGCDNKISYSVSRGLADIFIEFPRFKSSKSYSRVNLVLEAYLPGDYFNELIVDSGSGEIDLESLSLDRCILRSVSGDIDLIKPRCLELYLQTASGDIEISEGIFFEINTVSGDVKLDSVLINKDSRIETISGNIKILPQKDSDFEVDFSSISGNFESESDFKEGENVLKVKTVSGNLDIE